MDVVALVFVLVLVLPMAAMDETAFNAKLRRHITLGCPHCNGQCFECLAGNESTILD